MSKTVAETIIEVFADAGARRCYGVPGDTLNYVTDAIRRSDMRFVHVRHEEVGGFAAGADAMLTGELALCAGSCGPGGLHFINGLYESHRNRAPVVLIASQIVRDEIGFDFPQEVDFKAVYGPSSVFLRGGAHPRLCAPHGDDGGAGGALQARGGGADPALRRGENGRARRRAVRCASRQPCCASVGGRVGGHRRRYREG